MEAVQLIHADRAAADGARLDVQGVAVRVLQVEHDGVRVGVAQVGLVEFHLQAGGRGVFRAVAQAFVIDGHAEQTGDDRPVCAVAAIGVGEGAVKADARANGLLFQQAAGHEADARGPGGMRA